MGFTLQAPALAASTMLLALSHFTLCLVRSEEHLREAKRMFKSALRLGVDTSVLTKQFARADDLFARDKQWFGETIQTIAFGLIWLDCIDPRMAVLCCAVLCCAVLCCAVLCSLLCACAEPV